MNSSKILLNVSIERFRYPFSDEDEQKLKYVSGMEHLKLIQGIEKLLGMEGNVRDMHLFIGESTATGGGIGSAQREAYGLALRKELDKLVQDVKGGPITQIYKDPNHIYTSINDLEKNIRRRNDSLKFHQTLPGFFSTYRIEVKNSRISSSSVVIYPLNRILLDKFMEVYNSPSDF